MFFTFYDYEGIVHNEFVFEVQSIIKEYHLQVLNRFWSRTVRVRPEYPKQKPYKSKKFMFS